MRSTPSELAGVTGIRKQSIREASMDGAQEIVYLCALSLHVAFSVAIDAGGISYAAISHTMTTFTKLFP
jgi:hypothetical protein